LNLIDEPRCSHVFGVQRRDAGFLARAENQTAPVREAVALGEIEGMVKYPNCWENGKSGPRRLHVSVEPGVRQYAQVLPPAQLLNRFRKHLPEKHRGRGAEHELLKQLLGLHLLDWLPNIKHVKENV
jgi:hypothetical protein